jgi:hypothetical protein
LLKATTEAEISTLQTVFDEFAESCLKTPGGHDTGVGATCTFSAANATSRGRKKKTVPKPMHDKLLGDTFEVTKRRVKRQQGAAARRAAEALEAAALEAVQTVLMCDARATGSSLLVSISRLPVAGNSSMCCL